MAAKGFGGGVFILRSSRVTALLPVRASGPVTGLLVVLMADLDRLPRYGHLGTADAPVAPQRDAAYQVKNCGF